MYIERLPNLWYLIVKIFEAINREGCLLKKRVISAVVLLVIAFGCVFLSELTRVLFFAVAGLLCAYELSRALEKLEVYCCAWVMYVYICVQALLALFHLGPIAYIAGMAGCFYSGNLLFTAEDMKATIGKLPVIKPTLLVIVPGICDILSGLVKMYGPQFLGGELRMIISGAANVPPRLVDIFTKLGVEFCFGYGLTETANLTSANADAVRKPTSIGRIYPGQETKLVDGELLVKGDNVFSGYYKDPVRTAEAFTEDGWFRTGDLCRFDDEGFLYITGRIKNLIILPNGENVSPESLEEPFYADPCVRDAMVKEDDLNGAKVIAIEILPFMPAFDGKTPEEIHAYMQALVDKVNATLPTTHRIIKMTVRTEDFKRTGSMKVARV